jgi:osmotically inducible protein OsmC
MTAHRLAITLAQLTRQFNARCNTRLPLVHNPDSARRRSADTFISFLTPGAIMKKMASAVWKGGLKDGKGTLSTESGVLSNAQYGFKARFEDGPGTNPEELLGAAHAGCFSMALSAQLGEARMIAESISTIATVTLDKVEGGFSITAIHLDLTAKIPGADRQAFEMAADKAKSGCPLSKVLKAKITLDAKLEA